MAGRLISLPRRAAWRLATRMMVAMALADLLTRALHLHSGYWAMITTAVVVQGNLSGTLDAGISQLAGAVAGGLLGMLGVVVRMHHLAPDWLILLAVMAPLSLLAATDGRFRPAPVTGLIVLLINPAIGSSIDLALARIGEIAIGSVIGTAVSILVLPGRARAALIDAVAEGLRACGDLSCAWLAEPAPEYGDALHPLNRRADAAIARADQARLEFQRERSFRLAGATPVDPLLRTLRRLRTDVAMLGRAVSQGDHAPDAATPLRDWFHQAADRLLRRAAPPTPPDLPGAAFGPGPMRFCLDVMARDLADMAARISEYETRPDTPRPTVSR